MIPASTFLSSDQIVIIIMTAVCGGLVAMVGNLMKDRLSWAKREQIIVDNSEKLSSLEQSLQLMPSEKEHRRVLEQIDQIGKAASDLKLNVAQLSILISGSPGAQVGGLLAEVTSLRNSRHEFNNQVAVLNAKLAVVTDLLNKLKG